MRSEKFSPQILIYIVVESFLTPMVAMEEHQERDSASSASLDQDDGDVVRLNETLFCIIVSCARYSL